MKENIFDDLPPEQVYNELNEETLENIINHISVWSDENENTVIVIDYFAT